MSNPKGSHGGIADFNIHHGFIEALIRGMRCSFLKDADYHHITQCESLEDVKLNLSETDYADAVADMAVLTPSDLQAAAIQKVSGTVVVHVLLGLCVECFDSLASNTHFVSYCCLFFMFVYVSDVYL